MFTRWKWPTRRTGTVPIVSAHFRSLYTGECQIFFCGHFLSSDIFRPIFGHHGHTPLRPYDARCVFRRLLGLCRHTYLQKKQLNLCCPNGIKVTCEPQKPLAIFWQTFRRLQ